MNKFDRNPVPGETLYFRTTENFKSAHCHSLYLGPDKTGPNKILLATLCGGWIITDHEGLESSSRACGKFNIENEICNEDGHPIGYEYAYYDNSEKFLIKVSKNSGIWKITSDFQTPSWAE